MNLEVVHKSQSLVSVIYALHPTQSSDAFEEWTDSLIFVKTLVVNQSVVSQHLR